MGRFFTVGLAALSLGGCIYPSAGSQPRALLGGAGQPVCFIWCTIQIEVQNAEGSEVLGAKSVTISRQQTAGDLTNKQSSGRGPKR
jgi:hypothetical protein